MYGAGDYSIDVQAPIGYNLGNGQADPITFSMNPGQVKDVSVSLLRIPDPPKEIPPEGGPPPKS